jgi:predicted acetyltransferase
MNVEVVETAEEDRGLIENLAQLYAYDFSEILGFDVEPSGRFEAAFLREWPTEQRRCFIIRADGCPAGFALVGMCSVVSNSTDVTDMNEFFVLRKYRRQGVARTAAHKLFDMFPGRWEVREVGPNVAAQAFWREIISEYTDGSYEEQIIQGRHGPGPVQSFVSGVRKT